MAFPPTRDLGAALVTGASSGIGEEFARRLAGRGYNVVLVARRTDRLRALASRLGPMGVRAEVLGADLRYPDAVQALPDRIRALDLEVDVLVNCAGFGTFGAFVGSSLESQVGQVRVNVEAPMTLTHLLLPAMLERRTGAIVNVASVAGLQPLPHEAVYGATKAFLLSFTEALHVETRGTGVSVTAVSPGPVPTEWQAVAGYDNQPNFPPHVSTADVVDAAFDAVEKDRRAVIPGRLVRLSMLTVRSIPNSIKLPVIKRMVSARGN
jgi:short-subunit dehydrogenase